MHLLVATLGCQAPSPAPVDPSEMATSSSDAVTMAPVRRTPTPSGRVVIRDCGRGTEGALPAPPAEEEVPWVPPRGSSLRAAPPAVLGEVAEPAGAPPSPHGGKGGKERQMSAAEAAAWTEELWRREGEDWEYGARRYLSSEDVASLSAPQRMLWSHQRGLAVPTTRIGTPG
jgi:hypothetical protein